MPGLPGRLEVKFRKMTSLWKIIGRAALRIARDATKLGIEGTKLRSELK
jgi:hypothetical protein